ncbi:MAG TPA: hypothetical protein VE441_17225 [Mycobacterium sp.]|jgi:hypothetical protein|nr:hypothetical protein [Mycobacterium sp.]
MSPELALLAIAVVVATAMWLSLRAVPTSDLDVLPVRSLRRIRWWQLNARRIYACCAVLAATGLLAHIST